MGGRGEEGRGGRCRTADITAKSLMVLGVLLSTSVLSLFYICVIPSSLSKPYVTVIKFSIDDDMIQNNVQYLKAIFVRWRKEGSWCSPSVNQP